MMSDSVLQTFDLSKRYGDRWAVKDVNLTVRTGEVFGFLGPNGAGKSTTIRMLLSLVKPTGGRVELFGKSLHGHRKDVLSRVGGLVESADFYLYLSARRNLEMVATLKGDVRSGAIDEVLETVGLLDRASDAVKTFSHGMKQRLGIAQALLGFPDFIILDEPTSGLDPQGIKEVRELIRRLSTERGMAIFLSSHLLTEIEQTAESMAIINAGRLVVQGKVNDLLSAGEYVVRVDAEPGDVALNVAGRLAFVEEVRQVGGMLEIRLPQHRVAALNTELVHAGVQVRALVPKRSLEEYFLSITEGSSDVLPVRRRRR